MDRLWPSFRFDTGRTSQHVGERRRPGVPDQAGPKRSIVHGHAAPQQAPQPGRAAQDPRLPYPQPFPRGTPLLITWTGLADPLIHLHACFARYSPESEGLPCFTELPCFPPHPHLLSAHLTCRSPPLPAPVGGRRGRVRAGQGVRRRLQRPAHLRELRVQHQVAGLVGVSVHHGPQPQLGGVQQRPPQELPHGADQHAHRQLPQEHLQRERGAPVRAAGV